MKRMRSTVLLAMLAVTVLLLAACAPVAPGAGAPAAGSGCAM